MEIHPLCFFFSKNKKKSIRLNVERVNFYLPYLRNYFTNSLSRARWVGSRALSIFQKRATFIFNFKNRFVFPFSPSHVHHWEETPSFPNNRWEETRPTWQNGIEKVESKTTTFTYGHMNTQVHILGRISVRTKCTQMRENGTL